MRQFTKTNTIDVRLNEEKFYFPGQTIEGTVLLRLQKSAKTNHIRITFSGEMQIAIKDKETINLFQKTEILPVSPNSNGKAQMLEAKQHTFPFTFVVPENLPSSLELEKRKAHIRYKLTAIHDRPMVPESLSAKAEYAVQVLEYIDVESPEYNQPLERALDFVLATGRQQSQLKVSMPRSGYTRGDLVKLTILLTHYERFVKEAAIKVDLIRAVDISTPRNTLGKEEVLKSISHNVNIIGPYNFSQDFISQLPIPTSTPPSIRYKDKVIDIHYKVRIRTSMPHAKKNKWQQELELPIVVGTWPKASVPIDDDDDDGVDGPILYSEDEDEEDEEDQHSVAAVPPVKMTTSRSSSTVPQQHQHSQHHRNPSATVRSIPSTSAVNLSTPQYSQQNGAIMRSDSNASRSSQKSRNSQTSWRSSQSFEPHASPTLSRNTSAGTAITHPEIPLRNNNPGTGSGGIAQQCYFNRSSSTPDLFAQQQQYYSTYQEQQQQQQQQQQYYPPYQQQQQHSHPTSGPYYPSLPTHGLQPLAQNNNTSNTNNYQIRPTSVVAGGAPNSIYRQQQLVSPAPNPSRMPMPNRNYAYADEWNEQQQQTYSYPYPPLHHQQQQQQPYRIPQEEALSDDSDDSDDDGDLLRIIEKKKKREKRAAQSAVADGDNGLYKY